MTKRLVLFFMLLKALSGFGQTEQSNIPKPSKPFSIGPMPDCGYDVSKYIKSHLLYPKEAQAKGIEGTVRVQFSVRPDGTITDVKVTKSAHPILDAEAVRLVFRMPPWLHPDTSGKTVQTIPFRFVLVGPNVSYRADSVAYIPVDMAAAEKERAQRTIAEQVAMGQETARFIYSQLANSICQSNVKLDGKEAAHLPISMDDRTAAILVLPKPYCLVYATPAKVGLRFANVPLGKHGYVVFTRYLGYRSQYALQEITTGTDAIVAPAEFKPLTNEAAAEIIRLTKK